VIPTGITPDELRQIGGSVVFRTPQLVVVSVRELPPRETWRRWRKEFGVRLRARSWRELRELLTDAQKGRLFRAKVVRQVEGRTLVGYVLEADVLPTDRVLSRGRAPSRRG
jgi:hypothetical protein